MTANHFYNPITGEYNDSLIGEYLWSSVNTRDFIKRFIPLAHGLWSACQGCQSQTSTKGASS